jgi:hypothetical protein
MASGVDDSPLDTDPEVRGRENRIHLGMDHELKLGLSHMKPIIVGDPAREAIEAGGEDKAVLVHNDRAHAGGGVLGHRRAK